MALKTRQMTTASLQELVEGTLIEDFDASEPSAEVIKKRKQLDVEFDAKLQANARARRLSQEAAKNKRLD